MNSPFEPGSHVVGYIRDSGGEQQELSAKQQENYLRKWCNENGLVLTRLFIDASTGTTTRGRDQFQELINYFKTDPPEAGLIIWRHNRFARNVPDAQYYKGDIRRRGYIIHSLMDNIPQGTFQYVIETMEETFAQQKSEKLSEDVKRGLYDNLEDFQTLGGVPPKGFVRQPMQISTHRDGKPHMSAKWVPDPELVPTIQRAWRMRASGATYGQIKTATNLYSSVNSFATFFKNRLYIGELVFGSTVIKEYCTPIIDRKTWDAVQKLNQKNKRQYRPPRQRKSNSSYILSGLLTCGECGSPIGGNRIRSGDGKVYYYYRCLQRRRKRDCEAQSIPKKDFEAEILKLVKNKLLSPENIANALKTDAETRSTRKTVVDGEVKALKKQKRPLQRKINNLVAAIADAGHSQALLAQLEELEAQSRELQAQINLLEAEEPPEVDAPQIPPAEIGARLSSALDAATPQEKRIILSGFISDITVKRDGKKVQGNITYAPPPVLESKKEKPPDGGQSYFVHTNSPRGGTVAKDPLKFQRVFCLRPNGFNTSRSAKINRLSCLFSKEW